MSRRKLPLISIQYVSKSYDDNALDFDHLVLKNVSVDIHDGEFVIIFGPSGSGKSSMLNLMAGLEFPTAGRIMIRGHDMSHYSHEELAKYHRLRMGMVFQSFNLIKSLNVWENVALPQTANGVGYRSRKRRALRLLKLLGLEDYPDRHANELSGGEQQRVAIARALINNPYFMLVDEPTGNLDSKSAKDVMEIFQKLHAGSKHTIVMVTHNPEQLAYASRVIYIKDGQVVQDERRDQVTNQTYNAPLGPPQEHLEELAQYKTDPDDDHKTGKYLAHPPTHTTEPPQKGVGGVALQATNQAQNPMAESVSGMPPVSTVPAQPTTQPVQSAMPESSIPPGATQPAPFSAQVAADPASPSTAPAAQAATTAPVSSSTQPNQPAPQPSPLPQPPQTQPLPSNPAPQPISTPPVTTSSTIEPITPTTSTPTHTPVAQAIKEKTDKEKAEIEPEHKKSGDTEHHAHRSRTSHSLLGKIMKSFTSKEK